MLLFQVFNLENMLFQNKSEIYYASYEAIIQINNSIYLKQKLPLHFLMFRKKTPTFFFFFTYFD